MLCILSCYQNSCNACFFLSQQLARLILMDSFYARCWVCQLIRTPNTKQSSHSLKLTRQIVIRRKKCCSLKSRVLFYYRPHGKGKLLPKEWRGLWMKGTNTSKITRELDWNVLTLAEVFLNQKRINVCHTFILFWLKKDLCECQNISVKFPCALLVYFIIEGKYDKLFQKNICV